MEVPTWCATGIAVLLIALLTLGTISASVIALLSFLYAFEDLDL